jgi:mannose-6-phosphate isomerase-like protein (cupin superfamily)
MSMSALPFPAVSAVSAVPEVRPGRLLRAGGGGAVYRQRFSRGTGNLDLLSGAEHELDPGATSHRFALPGEEALLFMWSGHATAEVDGARVELEPYDTLYVPLGAPLCLANRSGAEPARLVQLSAPAVKAHPLRHGRFSELARREDRIRRLKGKDVYVMHGVDEGADKLVAGYTFFRPRQRSWPPHNHTDQEEVYVFIKGHGSMEVYESPETLTFVHDVRAGDMVTIPVLNYHPVFSQDEPLEFIWCIAGARYWVGDRSSDFMSGAGGPVTT